jgi:opacity protein-like surface antigen
MYLRLQLLFGFCLFLGSSWIFAQDRKFDVNGLIGFTLSEGIDVIPQEGDSLGINRLSPKSSFSFDFGLNYFLNEKLSVGLNFGQEKSKLRARIQALEGLDITNMNVQNYHGIMTYRFGDEYQVLRPFVFGGIGITNYSPNSVGAANFEGAAKFSTTWGAGIEYFNNDRFGFRGGFRWTPTYFKSEEDGVWCSSYWNWSCWMMENSNYSHQFELNAGIIVRF